MIINKGAEDRRINGVPEWKIIGVQGTNTMQSMFLKHLGNPRKVSFYNVLHKNKRSVHRNV
jgi:hypothetical protein